MMTGRWPTILLLWFAGVLAAAQLGKMAALIPAIRADLGLSLTSAGLMVSLIEAGGASLGAVAGILAARFSGRAVLAFGAILVATAGIAAALAPDATLLYAARLIESIGYLMVVIAAPSLIAMTAGRDSGAALALWSTFVPIGIASGTILSGVAASWVDWRLMLVFWALAMLTTLPGTLRLPAMAEHRQTGFAVPPLAIWALALGFGFYTTLEVGVLGMLPAYLSDAWGLSIGTAGVMTGIASAATIAGSFAAARLIGNGDDAQRPLALVAIGLVVPAALFFVGFPGEGLASALSGSAVAAAVIAANAVSGLVAAVAFARLPMLLRRSGAALSLITASNGVFAQFGAAGSLIGPPLVGYVASRWGWSTVAPVVAGLSILSLAGFAFGERLAARR
ncbi:CynX/NimT family MFS transporter [Pleomorphomonas sp. NRK KF1]|uniref:MFS transporter n=1 Tax=Pleomorphomonas sp. NRK KF1 TaxID=2943000 RepID=UPI0020433561|nr:MFS transporter [Pleomorphomonas sp. NRK KF1]MCM5555422.1 MFS transporter [Pleomorphomonas sp. NRK KF1]